MNKMAIGRVSAYVLLFTCCNIHQKPNLYSAPHKCFQEKNDILILMDGSKSMGKRNFHRVRSFLQDFLSRVDIGPSRTHVGVIQYSESHKTSIEVALDQYSTVEDLVTAVAKIMYQAGKEADLFNALRQADLMVKFLYVVRRLLSNSPPVGLVLQLNIKVFRRGENMKIVPFRV